MPRAKNGAGIGGGPPAKKPAAPKRNKKLYNMPEKVPEGTVLTDLTKTQWRIGPSIGIGGFGEIYAASKIGEKNSEYVVKCEPHENGPLFVERNFYMRNAKPEAIKKFKQERGFKSFGMPHILGSGSAEINGKKHRFLVMPRFGKNIQEFLEANGNRLPEGTCYRLALQMIDVYEYIHKCEYVHADLKAANILLGYGKGGGGQAYLVDFGLASHYLKSAFTPDPKKMHNGTIEYTSRDAHQGVPTRRGDFEILGYNLIQWLGAQLPWVQEKLLAIPVKVQKSKEEFMSNVGANLKKLFPKGVPVPLDEYMKYVATMKFDTDPDYNKCRKIFTSGLKALNVPNSGDLDFKLKAVKNNNATPIKQKNRARTITASSDDSEVSDDDDVIFEEKKPVKTAPKLQAKNVPKPSLPPKTPPGKKALKITPPKSPALANKVKTPLVTRPIRSNSATPPKKSQVKTPLKNRISPAARKARASSISPRIQKKITENAARSTNNTPTTSKTPKPLCQISAKTNINVTPTIQIKKSSKKTGGGHTVINDELTPQPHSSKTYEFNIDLDVSTDTNVVVNVRRKKKGEDLQSSGRKRRAEESESGTPVQHVKVRTLASEGARNGRSPPTPVVTLKKTTRFGTPR